jgi:hypothetical protein
MKTLMQYGKTNFVIASRSGTPLEHVNAKNRVRPQTNPGGIYDGQSGTGAGCFSGNTVFICQYNSASVPYSYYIYPHLVLCNISISANKTRRETYENDVKLTP